MKTVRKIIPLLLCVCIALLCSCSLNGTEESDNKKYGYDLFSEIDYGVIAEDIYLYSGEYPEDGSFENCENVVAIKVKNTSASDIQLLRINVKTNKKDLEFEITTLRSGATVIAFEKSKQTLDENEKVISIESVNRADFSNKISLKEDMFIVQGNVATINIKNISATEIQEDIYIYYKKKDADGNYFGGITFRTKVDGIRSGEIKQLSAANFNPIDSEVLFVDYAE